MAVLWLLLIGGMISLVWWLMGGYPFTDHDRYAAIPVPGTAVAELPAGDVRIAYQESGIPDDLSADMPDGMLVRVVAGDGTELPVERISEDLFSIKGGDTGHVAYGKIDVPRAGEYTIQVEIPEDASTRAAPIVAVGEPPWNPFGPPIVGAMVVLAPFLFISAVLIALRV